MGKLWNPQPRQRAHPFGSLHGTFVPAEHIRNQRVLPEPLPPQVPLLEKIYKSRLAHFVDVIYTRPQYRERGAIERTALHVLFPLSWVMLIMALTDAAKDHFRTYGMPEVLIFMDEIWRRATPYLHRDDLLSRLPIPQVSNSTEDYISLLILLAGRHRTLSVLLDHLYRPTATHSRGPVSHRLGSNCITSTYCIRISET